MAAPSNEKRVAPRSSKPEPWATKHDQKPFVAKLIVEQVVAEVQYGLDFDGPSVTQEMFRHMGMDVEEQAAHGKIGQLQRTYRFALQGELFEVHVSSHSLDA